MDELVSLGVLLRLKAWLSCFEQLDARWRPQRQGWP